MMIKGKANAQEVLRVGPKIAALTTLNENDLLSIIDPLLLCYEPLLNGVIIDAQP